MTEGYDYHFLILAPGLQGAWFFQAARQYWQRFQPIVTDEWELLAYIPEEAKVAVTLLARPDTAEYAREQIEAQREGVTLDMVVASDLPMMETILNARAESGRPFG
ncbi:MAG TPA: hypothetical protein ENI95_07775 [Chloroflexi bacterium]|nr:hypothetical protein [Chloroflexota bacterium]